MDAPVLVLDNRVRRIPIPPGALGASRTFRAYAGPHDAEGTSLSVSLDFGPALPLSPAHLSASRASDTGDVNLRWIRRSRSSASGWEYGDVPLESSPERYRVTILDGDTIVREIDRDAPLTAYSAAEQIADFGHLPSAFSFSVAQISPVLGPGMASTGVFP